MQRFHRLRWIIIGIVIYGVVMAALLAEFRMRFPH